MANLNRHTSLYCKVPKNSNNQLEFYSVTPKYPL